MTTLDAAQAWVSAGYSVIPIGYRSKRPAFDALKLARCAAADGRLSWDPFKGRQATAAELRLWFTGPKRNLGVVTGWNGLVVLDFDQADAYAAWMAWAVAAGGMARRVAAGTYRVRSARGVHVYVICEEPVESYAVPGVDVKGRWGYVLAPPSVHPSGYEYTATGGMVAHCSQLAEVFPFGKPPEKAVQAPPEALSNDPWEVATCAVITEGTSVEVAKQHVQYADIAQIAHQDRAGMWAHCPLHEDWNPSLRIYPDGGACCFQCGFKGDVLDLYARVHELTLRQAIAALSGCK